MRLSRMTFLGVALLASLLVAQIPSRKAFAVAKLVQVQTNAASGTSVSATLSPSAKPKHLIIVVCASRAATDFTLPTGFSIAKSEVTAAPSQEIFYKVATGGETTVACAGGTSRPRGIQLYEYSGTDSSATPFETTNAASSTGNSANASSGTLTIPAARPKALVLAAVAYRTAGTGLSGWTNTFAERADFTSTARFGGADRYTTTAGTYTTTVTNTSASAWRGQIVAFKLLPETLSGDIVDAANSSVVSPAVVFPSRTFDLTCQVSTATLGSSAQQLRVVNTTANAAWTLSLAATNGPTALWSDGGTNSYDFNDPTTAGCADGADTDTVAGQLAVDPSGATITPDTSCSAAGVSKGAAAAFSQGVTDSIPLVIGSASAEINCMWNITGISLSQQIPPEASNASYNLGLTLTLISN